MRFKVTIIIPSLRDAEIRVGASWIMGMLILMAMKGTLENGL
jgi:hypothetical protein